MEAAGSPAIETPCWPVSTAELAPYVSCIVVADVLLTTEGRERFSFTMKQTLLDFVLFNKKLSKEPDFGLR